MKHLSSMNNWHADHYDKHISYISEIGKGLLDLLQPEHGERILDLGCGTGDLANELFMRGVVPTGIDYSPTMIEKACAKYSHIQFMVSNAETFRTDQPFDAVFSNAALHWIKRPEKVIESVWLSLREGGRFVAEFGGKGNVHNIVESISNVFAELGISANDRNPWYFPSVSEYTSLLEAQGFRVAFAAHFERTTPFHDGEKGLRHWLDMFCDDFFNGFTDEQRTQLYDRIEHTAKPKLFRDGVWHGDYKRIRIVAMKE